MFHRAQFMVLLVACFCFLKVTRAAGFIPQSGTFPTNQNLNFNGGHASTNIAGNFKNIPIVPANTINPNMNGNMAGNVNGGATNTNTVATGTNSQSIFNNQARNNNGIAAANFQSSPSRDPAFVVGNINPKVFFTQRQGAFEPNVGFFPDDDINSQEPSEGLINAGGTAEMVQAAVFGLALTRALFTFFDFLPPTSSSSAASTALASTGKKVVMSWEQERRGKKTQ